MVADRGCGDVRRRQALVSAQAHPRRARLRLRDVRAARALPTTEDETVGWLVRRGPARRLAVDDVARGRPAVDDVASGV